MYIHKCKHICTCIYSSLSYNAYTPISQAASSRTPCSAMSNKQTSERTVGKQHWDLGHTPRAKRGGGYMYSRGMLIDPVM